MRDQTFTDDFRTQFELLMRFRRDVRRFRTDAVDEAVLTRCLNAFRLAPSVGLSEPWRVIRVESKATHDAAVKNFEAANAEALKRYSREKAPLYSGLKLSGMKKAPVHLAVFCDDTTDKGHGLGAVSMPEMRRYSVVSAITLFWLALRTEGLGLGWVSILDPEQMARDLDVPKDWYLIGYLCVGWSEEMSDTPELEQVGWEYRDDTLPFEVR